MSSPLIRGVLVMVSFYLSIWTVLLDEITLNW